MSYQPIICKSKEYESVAELARAFDMTTSTVRRRIERGLSAEQAVGLEPAGRQTTGHQVVLAGVAYPSRSAACKALGLSPKVVHARLKAGRTLEEAFGLESFTYASKPKTVVVGGTTFYSLVEACQFYGVDKYVLNARVNRYGWTLDEALGVVPRPGYERGVAGYVYLITNLNGKKYVGITMGTIEMRWQQHLAKAFSGKPLNPLGLHQAILSESAESFKIELLAKASSYGELCALEAKFVQDLNCKAPFGYNLNSGGGGTRTKGRKVRVGDKSFPSITAACRHFGYERRLATERLTKGWSAEQVFGLAPPPAERRLKPREAAGVA